ncbi:hypothetical protein AAC387_Pa08g1869 [Persea americana]
MEEEPQREADSRELKKGNVCGSDKEHNPVLQEVNSAGLTKDSGIAPLDNDKFKQVPLKEEGGNILDTQDNVDLFLHSNSDSLSQCSVNEQASESSMGKAVADLDVVLAGDGQDDHNELLDRGLKPSSSSASFDSYSGLYGDSAFSSPVGSPPKPKMKPAMPIVSPELLHLVDSTIMGNPGSLDKLRGVFTGKDSLGTEEQIESISFAVVDALLVTMGGVECFDDESGYSNPPSIMLNSRAAIVAGELIPWLPCEGDSVSYMSPRTRMVRGLLAILRACTRNRVMCSASGLLTVFLWAAEKIFVEDIKSTGHMLWDDTHLCNCIEILATHSLSALDLHRWFQVITKTFPTDWATHLMLTLEKAMRGNETRGPACTFEFDGESSGLLGPGDSRWPFSNGYAFATWIYIETFYGEGNSYMPRLFSFLSADNQGIEAYFQAPFLVIECSSVKGKKICWHLTYLFKPHCWYFVGIEHTCKQSLLGKAESELRLYIDGNLCETHPFEFPRISKPLSFCCIGTNPPPTLAGLQRCQHQCPLFAEMGPIYIFKEPIGPGKMARLASRGGDVLPSFGSGSGLPWLATNDHIQSLAEGSSQLDLEIGGSLHLLYHPKLLSGRFCPDACNSGSTGGQRRPAEVLGQVHAATRIRPAESMWALAYGGPMCLLPFTVSCVQKDSLEPQHKNSPLSLAAISLSAPIFRIISMAIQHPGNSEEFCCTQGPEVLRIILRHLLQALSALDAGKQTVVRDGELVAAIVSLCQYESTCHALKVQLFLALLLDLKIWSSCNYGLQKKLLSSLADMVFTESSAMRDANALQMLLDSCRRCYWIIRETDSVDTFLLHEAPRPMGEVNALVDELLVIIELLVGAASPTLAVDDIRCLIGFVVDCPQPNQVARVLHLLYRLVAQPNTSRAHTFADSFISCGGIETLLVLLQREAKAGNQFISDNAIVNGANVSVQVSGLPICRDQAVGELEPISKRESTFHKEGSQLRSFDSVDKGKIPSSENALLKKVGGISFSLTADCARNDVYNVDNGDGIVVGIINLLGALVRSGQLKFSSNSESSHLHSSFLGNGLHDDGSTMFSDRVSLLFFALQKAFQAASQRLMTGNVYMAFMGATMNVPSTDDGLNLCDSGYCFEHVQLLIVLLHSLPYASSALQVRVIKDLLFLACGHPDNRSTLCCMEEWPEWILEVFISNYEGSSQCSNGVSIGDVEVLVFKFLITMLEHSMFRKDGWKDIEATIHCAEWLSVVGVSGHGDQRVRREESVPVFKRKLLGGLLDFAVKGLQFQQTQDTATATGGSTAEGFSPQISKLESDSDSRLSILAENAIVVMMLVEDHLRFQSQLYSSSHSVDCHGSPISLPSSIYSRSNSGRGMGESSETLGSRRSSVSSESGAPSLDVVASMVDANGQSSAAAMENFAAAAAAEPYESVRCAFMSYGSCSLDLAEGWKYRSRMWYGVGLFPKPTVFGGGGSGWESWKAALEKDSDGKWIELPLIRKSIAMLQALLLDESRLGSDLSSGGATFAGKRGVTALQQLLDSDQPFLCMLRMILASMREDDSGVDAMVIRNVSVKDDISDGLHWKASNKMPVDNNSPMSTRKPRSALLWSVLAPVLNMPMSESKRQRVLVAACIFYSEVWHAVGIDGQPLRKQYLEAILPPFVAILRRWRPLLAGIHELTTSDGLNPLIADDRALAVDSLPLESALSMISPGWAAAFASPPAAMALAMIAAGASSTEIVVPARNTQLRRDSSLLERRTTRLPLHTFSSFQKPSETADKSPQLPKDKAAAKAAALAAARDLERISKIGTGRGLSAVAMATSAQRRSASNLERGKRWNDYEAMGNAWMECLQSVDTKSVCGKDFSALAYKYVAVLVASFALARNMKRMEMDRRAQVDVIDWHRARTGIHAWRKLIHCLIEIRCLFGPLGDCLCHSERVLWKLYSMENTSRMRRCMKRNYKRSDHLAATTNFDDHLLQLTIEEKAITLEDKNHDDEQEENDNFDDRMHTKEQCRENKQGFPATDKRLVQRSLDRRDSKIDNDRKLVRSASAVAPGYVPSESDEEIIFELSSLLIRPLRVVQGAFQITTKRINFIVDEHIGDKSMEPGLDSNTQNRDQEKDWTWLISSIHQIFTRRYRLRRSALELFMIDRSNFFFDFGTTEGRENAYRAIVHMKPLHSNSICLATQRPEELFKRTELMERWARWEISNFEYLMQLNTLAGRSYNDVTQYPIFPWILSDYSSKNLELGNPSSYRDLSKPIGALNADRLKKFQERYTRFDHPTIPKFHYGSHYSSARTVLYYLVRVEPFTTLPIPGERIFSDIGATWTGVLEDMNDVKELVPELFYLPEILVNGNLADIGTVKLPPWASNPVDFIHKHRKALESEHVSAHLNEWIDLIFGYKQREKEAVLANNVFFYTTYEGTIDIDKISDPVQQRAIQDQIIYFGQTPSQLLTVPHIKRRALADVLHLQTIFRNPNKIKPYVVPNPERCNVPAAAIFASSDSVIVVDVNAPDAHVALHKWQPNTPDSHGTPFLFQHGKATAGSAGGALMRMLKGPAGDWQFPQALAFPTSGIRSSAVVAATCDKEIITGGHADNSVKLISSDGAITIETAARHCAPVTCLALSPDSNHLVTGSQDTTLMLWRIHRAPPSQLSNISKSSTSAATTTCTNSPHSGRDLSNILDTSRRSRIEGPVQVLRGHLKAIVCCGVDSDMGIVVSCSQSSGVLLHSVRGRLIRKLEAVEADAVCLSAEGVVVTWNKSMQKLSTFTINGIPIATAFLSFSGSISCMEVSVDGGSALIGTTSFSVDKDREYQSTSDSRDMESDNLKADDITLSSQGSVVNKLAVQVPSICFLDLHTLKIYHTLKLKDGQDITAVALNKDNTNLLVSTADKQLIIFTDPDLSLNAGQMLPSNLEGNNLTPSSK